MVQTVHPERLRQTRIMRRLSREALAAKAKLTAKTISRLEKGNEARPIRQANLERLARALDVAVGVLTGEERMPLIAGHLGTATEEAAYQLNVRVDGAVRNAFELVARRYGVSVSKIATLAPLLFVILAEASLKHRSKNVEDCRTKYEEYLEAKSQIPYHIPAYELGSEIEAEERSIGKNDIFGRTIWNTAPDNWDRGNPFATYLQALTAGRDNIIKINAVGPKSTDYRVCRLEAVELAGDEFAEALLNGEVPIHRMTREVESAALSERIEWMRQHKISVVKVEEEPPHDVPERPPIDPSLVIDIEI